jgi:hypothetical protein
MKGTTFGYHTRGQAWTFRSLSYRIAQGVALHGGIVRYP